MNLLKYPGGIPTSNTKSGQQWDLPNSWAPLVEIVIAGLMKSDLEVAQNLAFNITQMWVATNYVAWAKTGIMFEKVSERKVQQIGELTLFDR